MTTATRDVLRILDQFDKDNEFLSEHKQEWIEEQPDRWVVVYKEKLVCWADTYQEAFDAAVATGIEEIRSNMVIRFITDKPRTMIL